MAGASNSGSATKLMSASGSLMCEDAFEPEVDALPINEMQSPELENVVNVVCKVFDAPAAYITLMGSNSLWICSSQGIENWDTATCMWVVNSKNSTALAVDDMLKDTRFARSPQVLRGNRACLTSPVLSSNGSTIGAICVCDTKPRSFTADDCSLMNNFAFLVTRELQQNPHIQNQLKSDDRGFPLSMSWRNSQSQTPKPNPDGCVLLVNTSNTSWPVVYAASPWQVMTGLPTSSAIGVGIDQLFKPTLTKTPIAWEGAVKEAQLGNTFVTPQICVRSHPGRKFFMIFHSLGQIGSSCSACPGLPDSMTPSPPGKRSCPLVFATLYHSPAQQERSSHQLRCLSSDLQDDPLQSLATLFEGLKPGGVIGEGRFGTVYEAAWHEAQVAVKVQEFRIRNDDDLLRAESEVQMGQQLSHLGITRFVAFASHAIDSGCDDEIVSSSAPWAMGMLLSADIYMKPQVEGAPQRPTRKSFEDRPNRNSFEERPIRKSIDEDAPYSSSDSLLGLGEDKRRNDAVLVDAGISSALAQLVMEQCVAGSSVGGRSSRSEECGGLEAATEQPISNSLLISLMASGDWQQEVNQAQQPAPSGSESFSFEIFPPQRLSPAAITVGPTATTPLPSTGSNGAPIKPTLQFASKNDADQARPKTDTRHPRTQPLMLQQREQVQPMHQSAPTSRSSSPPRLKGEPVHPHADDRGASASAMTRMSLQSSQPPPPLPEVSQEQGGLDRSPSWEAAPATGAPTYAKSEHHGCSQLLLPKAIRRTIKQQPRQLSQSRLLPGSGGDINREAGRQASLTLACERTNSLPHRLPALSTSLFRPQLQQQQQQQKTVQHLMTSFPSHDNMNEKVHYSGHRSSQNTSGSIFGCRLPAQAMRSNPQPPRQLVQLLNLSFNGLSTPSAISPDSSSPSQHAPVWHNMSDLDKGWMPSVKEDSGSDTTLTTIEQPGPLPQPSGRLSKQPEALSKHSRPLSKHSGLLSKHSGPLSKHSGLLYKHSGSLLPAVGVLTATGEVLKYPVKLRIYMVMELMDAGNLQDAIDHGWFHMGCNKAEALNIKVVLETAQEIARALAFVHEHNICHGDISPANVLLKHALVAYNGSVCGGSRNWSAKLSDFGMAVQLSPGEETMSITDHGLITHAAPEVLESMCMSKAADVYSFGVILWQLLTGSRPWKKLSHEQIVVVVGLEKMQLVFPQHCHAGIKALAASCLRADRTQRPTAAAVCASIAKLLAQCERQNESDEGEEVVISGF